VFEDVMRLLANQTSSRPRWRLLPGWGGGTRSGAWLLAVSIAGAALAVGTVHTITLCVVTAALAVATALTWWGAEPTNARPAATLLLVTGVVLTAYTALQCVPMPMAWLWKIAPRNADVWSRALTPLHEEGPRWAPVSLDPTATRIEVLKGVAYLLAFVTALRVARRRGGVSFLSGVLVVTGLVLAIAAVLHPAFNAHKLFGIFDPLPQATNRHVAPFLNPNNLASYLNIAFCIALASAVSDEPRLPRPISASIAVLLAATQVWVASRGGVGAMVLGALLVVVVSRGGSITRNQRAAGASLSIVIALTAGVFLFVLGGSEAASSELLNTNAAMKLELFREALHMVPAYPIFGTGRGAFESTFPAFRGSIWITTYTHPENVLLQWAIEWGAPVALAGLAAVAFGLRPRAALARSAMAAGAWAAIVAVAVQNLVDLGSEIPGLMLAVVVCAAIVVGGTAGHEARWRVERWGRTPRAVATAGVLAAGLAIAMAANRINEELGADRMALHDAAAERQTSAETMHARVRAAMLRHPAEPYLPFILGWRAEHAHDDDPMTWIEATLDRARVYAPAHLVLAHVLLRRSPSQARLEYRLTAEQAPELAFLVGAEGAQIVGGYYDAMEVVAPSGQSGPAVLDVMGEAIQWRLPATRVRLDAELAARMPGAAGPALRAANDAVEDLEGGEASPWCEGTSRDGCAARALALAKRAQELSPRNCDPHALRAQVLISIGDSAAALRDFASAADGAEDRVACLKRFVTLAVKEHDAEQATVAITKIADAGCSSDDECAGNLAWSANEEETRGRSPSALALYKRAYDRAPGNDDLLANVARLAASAGLHTEAAEDYERLARKQPQEPRWKRAATAQRSAL
jgi:tetratricopeptide (TPR) repeat protein